MDAEFKKTGHENVAMPALIPESLLKKEGELVNGFAPEVAWVTMGGSESWRSAWPSAPPLRPCSATTGTASFRPTASSPCSITSGAPSSAGRKRPVRSCAAASSGGRRVTPSTRPPEEARAETAQQLNCYADFFENVLAIPVVRGRKTDKEKFAGAEATYTVECMMKDRKALQGATSHYFGDKFSRAYDVTFAGRDNKLQYPHQTSWGSTTRLIGAVIMTHGDDNGLVLPPRIAPRCRRWSFPSRRTRSPEVAEAARSSKARLLAIDVRTKLDDSDQSMGWKCAEYEMRGVPLRIEIGPRDLENGQCCIVRRDNGEKDLCRARHARERGQGTA